MSIVILFKVKVSKEMQRNSYFNTSLMMWSTSKLAFLVNTPNMNIKPSIKHKVVHSLLMAKIIKKKRFLKALIIYGQILPLMPDLLYEEDEDKVAFSL